MLVDGVLGIEKLLDLGDGEGDSYPIVGSAGLAKRRIDPIIRKPVSDEIRCFCRRSEKTVNLLLGQMLTIAGVRWVRD